MNIALKISKPAIDAISKMVILDSGTAQVLERFTP